MMFNAEHGQRIMNHREDTASTRKVLGGVAELEFALPKWLLNQPKGVDATACVCVIMCHPTLESADDHTAVKGIILILLDSNLVIQVIPLAMASMNVKISKNGWFMLPF